MLERFGRAKRALTGELSVEEQAGQRRAVMMIRQARREVSPQVTERKTFHWWLRGVVGPKDKHYSVSSDSVALKAESLEELRDKDGSKLSMVWELLEKAGEDRPALLISYAGSNDRIGLCGYDIKGRLMVSKACQDGKAGEYEGSLPGLSDLPEKINFEKTVAKLLENLIAGKFSFDIETDLISPRTN